jgi:hypothetical protein
MDKRIEEKIESLLNEYAKSPYLEGSGGITQYQVVQALTKLVEDEKVVVINKLREWYKDDKVALKDFEIALTKLDKEENGTIRKN